MIYFGIFDFAYQQVEGNWAETSKINICINYLYICSMNLDNNKIAIIKRYFETRPVLNAYLFGSYVRGNANSQSDIDILVDLDYSQRIGLQFIQMKIDLERILNNRVDLVSSNGLSKYIKPLIDSEKQLIYAR